MDGGLIYLFDFFIFFIFSIVLALSNHDNNSLCTVLYMMYTGTARFCEFFFF